MDKRSQSLPCNHRTRNARLREELCGHQQLHQTVHRTRQRDLSVRLQIPGSEPYRLQPPADASGRIHGKAQVLCHQLRRPASFAPLQPAGAGAADRHRRCLRSQLYGDAEPEPLVDGETGRLLSRKRHHTLRSNHLVFENLQGRPVLHLSACDRIAQPAI